MTNPNPVLEFSADGAMTYCNEAARRLAASSRRAILSAAIIPPEKRKPSLLECLLHRREHA